MILLIYCSQDNLRDIEFIIKKGSLVSIYSLNRCTRSGSKFFVRPGMQT